MNITMYQVDTFTNELFTGNPVAVCLTKEPLSVDLMLKLARENNLSETAFCYKDKDCYQIRWFSPEVEIDLCGHATLGAAYALLQDAEKEARQLVFQTHACGKIVVTRDGPYLTLLFPLREGKPIPCRPDIARALGGKPLAFYESRDIMVVYETAEEVAALTPDPDKINNLGVFGIIATAPGDGQPQLEGHSKDQQNCQLQPASTKAPLQAQPQIQTRAATPGAGVDFVSRYFCPGSGVFEDQATGSTHCTLIPYWMKRLHKTTFIDRQLSKRVGTFRCEVKKEQLYLKGEAVLLYKTSFAL